MPKLAPLSRPTWTGPTDGAVRVAIIGSGPAGLSAAVTAARCGVSHVLLERTDHLSDTIYRYQKGKKVMAHPLRLPLLGDLTFAESARETVLDVWQAAATAAGANVRLGCEVVAIEGSRSDFRIILAGGEVVRAELVVLAIGLQGNQRRLEIPGADRDWVQYQLDDPDAYRGERITVVGAGDAGIENALALCAANDVTIINRAPDFSRAKPGNVADAERAVRAGTLRAWHGASPNRIEDGRLVIDTRGGEVTLPCDRVIARLGAIPPRRFLEACGIVLPSQDPAAVPELTHAYESNVSGLYIIGALAGYTLIKQALNQGNELIRRLAGQQVEPADEGLLKERFQAAFPKVAVRHVLEWLRARVPMLADLTTLQLREVMLDSDIHRLDTAQPVFSKGDYTSSLWNVAEGAALVDLGDGGKIRIEAGEFFGELGLISGRRRNATVTAAEASIFVEIPRRAMRRLETSVAAIPLELDRVALRRIVHTALAPHRPIADLDAVIQAATLHRYKAGDPIITRGEAADSLFVLRTGSAMVVGVEDGREVDLDYLEAGEMFGERSFLSGATTRAATIRATIASEAVRIEAGAITAAMQRMPELRGLFGSTIKQQLDQSLRRTVAQVTRVQSTRATASGADRAGEPRAVAFLAREGIGEATNAFFIDESLCTRCGNCESACAATHDGISRVSRAAGKSATSILLPEVCRHCENPHCMSDCPPDAIHREASGEVVIDQATCIGCSNCANNCPYDAIQMVDPAAGRDDRPWLVRLLNGIGVPGPTPKPAAPAAAHEKKAVKCDLCRHSSAGPACVNACPTGAAARVDPETYLRFLREGRP